MYCVPAVAALYHLISAPAATKSLTILASVEQKICADAVGAAGVGFTVTVTGFIL